MENSNPWHRRLNQQGPVIDHRIEAPSLLRYGTLGAIAAASVGVVDSFLHHAQYGFSHKIGGAPTS